ncbi:hypothetical protein CKA32_004633 [Geitlerinema sp. FC II]|nr:hypothetical protein CKA32_004633 [Geitlerinema sp. FC II]
MRAFKKELICCIFTFEEKCFNQIGGFGIGVMYWMTLTLAIAYVSSVYLLLALIRKTMFRRATAKVK